jgi:protein TonB
VHGLVAMEREQAGAGATASLPRSSPVGRPATFIPAASMHRYADDRRPNWIAIAAIAAGHLLLLIALVRMDVIAIGRKPAPPMTIDLISIAPPPQPPVQPVDPKPEIAPVMPVQPQIVAPPPIVQAPAAPPPVAVAAAPPPPQAVIVATAPKSVAAPAAPVSVDLSTKMVFAPPPRYPVESRRKHEEGTVTLRLLLGVDGTVNDIAVGQSSGFDRLDKAALDAVRRWRWSPTLQSGEAVQVRGMVEIPFVLQR